MNVSRTVPGGASDRRRRCAPVFDSLRAQVDAVEQGGVTHAQLAAHVVAIVDGVEVSSLGPTADGLAWRLAWVVTVHAPAYDPVLVATLPFCLESIAEGFARLGDLFEHIETAEPVQQAPVVPADLPQRGMAELRQEVRAAADGLRDDPMVLERIIDRIGREGVDERRSPAGVLDKELGRSSQRTVVQRLPRAVRDAVTSVLQVDPAPGAVPLMQEIAGRLDPRSVHRLAIELVHASSDEPSLRVRVRAAASLLAMQRDGLLNRV